MRIGIDFGTTNTDAVLLTGAARRCWTLPTITAPDERSICAVLEEATLKPVHLRHIAVTGGNRSRIPSFVGGTPVSQAGEIDAIGRGGLALAREGGGEAEAAIIVSAGSGTAVVKADARGIEHVTGTGIGGGALVGLGRLLLGASDPRVIDALALEGNANAVNLTIGDVIGGALGRLPADATAVNFGRLARYGGSARREDIAAALVELVAQVVAVVGINAARIHDVGNIVITGHLTDMTSIRNVFQRIAEFSGVSITVPEHGGYAVALGAILTSLHLQDS